MSIIKHLGGGIKVKKYYTVLDLPEVKIVTLTLSKRSVYVYTTQMQENGRELITALLRDETNKSTMLLLDVMLGYNFAGVSYDKYDMTITLLRDDINKFG